MPKIKFDLSDREFQDGSSIEAPKPGYYNAKVTEVELVGKKANQDIKQLRCRYQIVDPGQPHNGWSMYDYVPVLNSLTDSNEWVLDRWLTALGVRTAEKTSGEFDPEKQVGKMIRISVKADSYENKDGEMVYSPRVGGVYAVRDSDEQPSRARAGSVAADDAVDLGEEAPNENLFELGEAADEGDDDSATRLTEMAEEAGLDPDSFETWAALAEVLSGSSDSDLEEEEEEEEIDYSGWDLATLKAECEARELPTKGTKSQLISRLEKYDAENPY